MDIYHTHHIIPRHMGGTDDPENLVKLTVEEHAQAHLNLYHEHGKIEDLWAHQLLSNQISVKEGFQKLLVKNAYDTHLKQKQRGTGIFNSEEQSRRGKMAAKSLLVKANYEKNRKMLNETKISCPHCGKEGQYRAMKRWHFDNCKSIRN